MIDPEVCMTAWDKAATPDENGFHNGAGFAMNNWKEIRELMKRMIQSEGW